MRVLHTIAGLWQTTGGPARSVPGLCRELARLGAQVTLVTGAGDLAAAVRRLPPEVSVRVVRLGPAILAEASTAFAAACLEAARDADIVHNHGLWRFPNWAAAWSARRAGRPLVISPRGMLARPARQTRRWAKAAAWQLLERRAFSRAVCLHATGELEADDLRAAGALRPIAIIPNGVDLEEFPEDALMRRRGPVASGAGSGRRPTVLFLSRIHPHKGWALLLDAWRHAALGRRADLVFAGGGRSEHIRQLETALGSGPGVGERYVGAVDDAQRLDLLARADIVVLPSRSESYGMVVAEALACGTPVVTTTATPWSELVDARCGWWVEAHPEPLARALAEAIALGAEERRAMGDRGRAWVQAHHSLQAASRRMLETYEWALGGGLAPAWVRP